MGKEDIGFENNVSGENSFEAQFENKEELELAGGKAEVVDISPDTPKTEIPVFLAPSWGCTTEVYKPALKELVDHDRRTISLDHPRIGGDMKISEEEAVEKYPTEELRKALNILGVMEQKGVDKVDVIAHSEGAINAAIAAMIHPEKFRNMVLFAPAGMIGEDTFTRLLKGFAGQSKRADTLKGTGDEEGRGWKDIEITETEKQVASDAATGVLKYFAKNPLRSIRETMDISKSQIHEMLRYLHEKGIGIVVMSGVDDPVFPMDKMQEIAKYDMLDGFLSLRGGHGEIGNHPELYMAAAEKMLTALEEKQKSRKEGEASA